MEKSLLHNFKQEIAPDCSFRQWLRKYGTLSKCKCAPPQNIRQTCTITEFSKRSRFTKSVSRWKFSRRSPSSNCDYRYTSDNNKLGLKKNILSNPLLTNACVGAVEIICWEYDRRGFDCTDVLCSCNIF